MVIFHTTNPFGLLYLASMKPSRESSSSIIEIDRNREREQRIRRVVCLWIQISFEVGDTNLVTRIVPPGFPKDRLNNLADNVIPSTLNYYRLGNCVHWTQ